MIKDLSLCVAKYIDMFLENIFTSNISQIKGPIFIVGAPRSGTTLLSQVLLHEFSLAYISNMHARWLAFPVLGKVIETVKRKIVLCEGKKVKCCFESDFGKTYGATSPHEAAMLWYRWFVKGDTKVSRSLDPQVSSSMRRTISALQRIDQRPWLFKNTYNSLRIEALASVFPSALFIYNRRNELDNALSLLRARSITGNDDNWYSVPIPNLTELLEKDKEYQVATQIVEINAIIDAARIHINKKRFLEVTYEELCEKQDRVLSQIKQFFSEHNINVEQRYESAKPSIKKKKFSDHHLRSRMEKVFEEVRSR